MLLRLNSVLAVIVVTLLFGAYPAWTVSPKMIVQHGKWSAYEYKDGNNKVCYMLTKPIKEEGNYSKRGGVHMMITHRPPQSFNVVSLHAGYSFGEGATVDLHIDKSKFELFTEGETAWAPNDLDGQIVEAIKRGKTIVVKGKSSKGTVTQDTYSLSGSSTVYKAMSKACGGVR